MKNRQTLPMLARFAMEDELISGMEIIFEKFGSLPHSGWEDIFNSEVGLP